MGGCERRAGACLWPSMALMAGWAWRYDRSDQQSHCRHQEEPGLAAVDRDGVESGGCAEDGAAAMPLPVPVLCRERKALLPALSALRRYLPRRAVQHRELCAADDDGGASDGAN